ncbi:MAG: COX15/CtaA family protein [Gammaproteobacteria bacterium]|nr:COX15/CtaA family protein [Gammaproteobacteria bacterium]
MAGVLLAFGVVVLGAYVRLSAAGLGCPDWPGCYGHLTPAGAAHSAAAGRAFPSRPLEVGKAWREMAHRYAAGTLGLTILAIAVLAVAERRRSPLSAAAAVGLLALVCVQALLGMLTVTWQLKPLIVTLHLLLGLTTLALLWWLVLSLPVNVWRSAAMRTPAHRVSGGGALPFAAARRLVVLALLALAVQIFLGGWTSSNYAALACPDLPTCQGALWPAADFRHAFTLWHGLDVNYEGGVLAQPARVAIHLTHRLMALLASVSLAAAALFVLRSRGLAAAHSSAWAVLAALALQLSIAVSMVLKGFPLWLATAHNAGAALLLLATLALLRALTRSE